MFKKISLLFLFITFLSFNSQSDCGVYRWDYKILIDADGLLLLKAEAKTSSINKLTKIKRPPNSALKNQRADAENQKVIVTAIITAYGKEEDGDYHLVLQSPTTDSTLIAEIPDPNCDKLKGFPTLKKLYSKARSFIEANIGNVPSRVTDLDESEQIKVKVTGIPFFDKRAHGNGHAANGIEIHPILKITKAN